MKLPDPDRSYPHRVLDWYLGQVREIAETRRERIARIKTQAEAQRYCRRARNAIRRAFGPMPKKWPPRTMALNTRITGTVTLEHFRIEKLIFESRPGFLVSANLYLPGDLPSPAPGVVLACGHSEVGKAEPFYQSAAQRLAQNGFAVIVYDPISQGERDQYGAVPPARRPKGCCEAHNMAER